MHGVKILDGIERVKNVKYGTFRAAGVLHMVSVPWVISQIDYVVAHSRPVPCSHLLRDPIAFAIRLRLVLLNQTIKHDKQPPSVCNSSNMPWLCRATARYRCNTGWLPAQYWPGYCDVGPLSSRYPGNIPGVPKRERIILAFVSLSARADGDCEVNRVWSASTI